MKRLSLLFVSVALAVGCLLVPASAAEKAAGSTPKTYDLSYFYQNSQLYYPDTGNAYTVHTVHFPSAFVAVKADEEADGTTVFPGYVGDMDFGDIGSSGLERGSMVCYMPGEDYTLDYIRLKSVPERSRFYLYGSISLELFTDYEDYYFSGDFEVATIYYDSNFKAIGSDSLFIKTFTLPGGDKYYTWNYNGGGDGFELTPPDQAVYFTLAVGVNFDYVNADSRCVAFSLDFSQYRLTLRSDYWGSSSLTPEDVYDDVNGALQPGLSDIEDWIASFEDYILVFASALMVYRELLGYVFNHHAFSSIILIVRFCFYLGLFGMLLNLTGSVISHIVKSRSKDT